MIDSVQATLRFVVALLCHIDSSSAINHPHVQRLPYVHPYRLSASADPQYSTTRLPASGRLPALHASHRHPSGLPSTHARNAHANAPTAASLSRLTSSESGIPTGHAAVCAITLWRPSAATDGDVVECKWVPACAGIRIQRWRRGRRYRRVPSRGWIWV